MVKRVSWRLFSLSGVRASLLLHVLSVSEDGTGPEYSAILLAAPDAPGERLLLKIPKRIFGEATYEPSQHSKATADAR